MTVVASKVGSMRSPIAEHVKATTASLQLPALYDKETLAVLVDDGMIKGAAALGEAPRAKELCNLAATQYAAVLA